MDFEATLRRLQRAFPAHCSDQLEAAVLLMATPGQWRQGQWFPAALELLGQEAPPDVSALRAQLLCGQLPPNVPFLEYPPDVQPDWAQAIVDFQEWLMAQLHAIHGLPVQGDELVSWPRAARRLCQNLGLAHAALLDRTHSTILTSLSTPAQPAGVVSRVKSMSSL